MQLSRSRDCLIHQYLGAGRKWRADSQTAKFVRPIVVVAVKASFGLPLDSQPEYTLNIKIFALRQTARGSPAWEMTALTHLRDYSFLSTSPNGRTMRRIHIFEQG